MAPRCFEPSTAKRRGRAGKANGADEKGRVTSLRNGGGGNGNVKKRKIKDEKIENARQGKERTVII